MYVVEVAPIQRGVLRGSLSFFSRNAVTSGAVVSAPVRGKMVPAIALSCTDVREGKLDVKSSSFALKKLGTATPRILFSEHTIRALTECARLYVTSPGILLSALTFSTLLATPRSLSQPALSRSVHTTPEVLTLQAELGERVQVYRNLVRESFARKQSVCIVVSTLVEVEALYTELSRGIEHHVVTVSSTESKAQLKLAWNRVADTQEPVLVIGTPPSLLFPIAHLDTIVIERESSRAYVSRTTPHLDFRKVAEILARMCGVRLVLADFPLRTETFVRRELGTADEWTRPQVRTQSTATVTVSDTRIKSQPQEKRSFAPLQPQTYDVLAQALRSGRRAVVYAARKGIAPLTICNDCGTPVSDPVTHTPMTLTKTPQGNVFISRRTGAVLPAERSCGVCGGWNLVTLGIGIDRVLDDIRKKLPESEPVVFTADTVTTHAAAEKSIRYYLAQPQRILVGTERMLPYLPSVSVSVVASIDTVLSLPSWRAHEHALSTLYRLIAVTEDHCIIETRRPDTSVLKSVSTGSPIEFLREEAKERRMYGYPPYATFIGLTWHGAEARCTELAETIRTALTDYDIVGPLPPELVERNMFRQRAVIRREPHAWPDDALLEILHTLPPEVVSTIDPDDIV